MCCHVEVGYAPLEISLTRTEKKKWGTICIETECEFLGKQGCTLGDEKPFSCKMYPLAFDPKLQRFYFDSECPLMATYVEQLADPESDAATHLAAVQKEIRTLSGADVAFLKRNFAVDSDYFALQPLPVPPLSETEKE
jgi:Fe-S-cluster containining protein